MELQIQISQDVETLQHGTETPGAMAYQLMVIQ